MTGLKYYKILLIYPFLQTVLMIDVVSIYILYLPCRLYMWKSLSCVQLFVIPWTVDHQVPLFMGILQARILVWVHTLLQGIFSTQGSNPGLLHCGWILYQLSYQGSPLRCITLRTCVIELPELAGGNTLQLPTVGTCLITKPLFANFPSLFTSGSPTSICRDNMQNKISYLHPNPCLRVSFLWNSN